MSLPKTLRKNTQRSQNSPTHLNRCMCRFQLYTVKPGTMCNVQANGEMESGWSLLRVTPQTFEWHTCISFWVTLLTNR